MLKRQMIDFDIMKQTHKIFGYALITAVVFAIMSFTLRVQQTKVYKLELTPQEVQIIYDAMGELPAKTSEGIRMKIAKQVNEQNTPAK
jgi:hypothetical protein